MNDNKFMEGQTVRLLPAPDHQFTVVQHIGLLVTCYPRGGGFRYTIPASELEAVPDRPPQWRPARFCIDDGPAFHGWTAGDRWNGWAVPAFELEVAHELVRQWPESFKWDGQNFVDITIDGEPQVVRTVTVGKLTLYLMGDGFCWDQLPD